MLLNISVTLVVVIGVQIFAEQLILLFGSTSAEVINDGVDVYKRQAQKSSDMFAKCRYLDEITGGRGVVFATGTPVSNSMVELYTMMRYLQYDLLQSSGLEHFDSWAANFGETTTALELAPEGTGFRSKTRFAKFFNLPELMAMWRGQHCLLHRLQFGLRFLG